ncbi:MAG TPA: hypothetical protein VFG47_05220 [Geminicoccaceae bacterium]|nr:hypothetical protein [Geminicoccaceae bacterium]
MSSRAATLHSGLLARKGHAAPAPGGYGATVPAAATAALPAIEALPPAPPRPKPVSLVADTAPTPEAAAPRPRRAPSGRPPREGAGDRLRFTFRLDRQRYKQLKILAAQSGLTSREIVARALECYLKAAGPACACLRDCGEGCDSA